MWEPEPDWHPLHGGTGTSTVGVWRTAFGEVAPTSGLTFATGGIAPFGTQAVPLDRHAFVAELGAEWRVTPAMVLSLAGSTAVGTRAFDRDVKAKFDYRF